MKIELDLTENQLKDLINEIKCKKEELDCQLQLKTIANKYLSSITIKRLNKKEIGLEVINIVLNQLQKYL